MKIKPATFPCQCRKFRHQNSFCFSLDIFKLAKFTKWKKSDDNCKHRVLSWASQVCMANKVRTHISNISHNLIPRVSLLPAQEEDRSWEWSCISHRSHAKKMAWHGTAQFFALCWHSTPNYWHVNVLVPNVTWHQSQGAAEPGGILVTGKSRRHAEK